MYQQTKIVILKDVNSTGKKQDQFYNYGQFCLSCKWIPKQNGEYVLAFFAAGLKSMVLEGKKGTFVGRHFSAIKFNWKSLNDENPYGTKNFFWFIKCDFSKKYLFQIHHNTLKQL